jgi:hypothetical protein
MNVVVCFFYIQFILELLNVFCNNVMRELEAFFVQFRNTLLCRAHQWVRAQVLTIPRLLSPQG